MLMKLLSEFGFKQIENSRASLKFVSWCRELKFYGVNFYIFCDLLALSANFGLFGIFMYLYSGFIKISHVLYEIIFW